MSLAKPSLIYVVKKQFAYKIKAYSQAFLTLVVLQILAILFSLNGVGMSGSSSERIEMSVHYYSGDIVVVFTMLWAFITAITITTKANRNDDFSFVTNRLSSNLSNTLFLLIASIIGGITAILSTNIIIAILYYFSDQVFLYSQTVMSDPKVFVIGFLTTSFYIFLFSALGYFAGTLVQIYKAFAFLLPVAIFGLMYSRDGAGEPTIMTAVFEFIFKESSILLFITKIIVIVSLLFSSTIALSNRMEVKQ